MYFKIIRFLKAFRRFVSNSELWIQDTGKYAYQMMLSQNSLRTENLLLYQIGFKVYSQWEEDGIFFYLSKNILTSKPRILELGSGNFLESNSRFLCEYMNASAYCVDVRADLDSGIDESGLRWKTHIEGLNSWIDYENISSIQKNAQIFLGHIDILSVDLDGQDYWILQAMNLDEIKIICVEYNPLFGSRACVTVPKDRSFTRSRLSSNLFWGASIRAFLEYLGKKGFVFVGSNLVSNNGFFVRKDFIQNLSIRIPDENFLLRETDYLIRESVNDAGNLSFLNRDEAFLKIKNEKVYDLNLGREVLVSQCID